MTGSLFGRAKPFTRALQLAVVGLPGSGKTSFLAALHGTQVGRTMNGADWSVTTDPGSRSYLGAAWLNLRNGLPVRPTLPDSEHPELTLDLRRTAADGQLTHNLALKCIDTAGEFARARDQRSGAAWIPVAQRIRQAHVLLLVVDAMNVMNKDDKSQAQFTEMVDMFQDACQAPGEGLVTLEHKRLAVCFCKCDAISAVDIDGFEDDRDALVLAELLIPELSRRNLKKRFAAVGYFGVSVLRDRWRWTREGACVRVGNDEVKPVGLFEPFEWISQSASEKG